MLQNFKVQTILNFITFMMIFLNLCLLASYQFSQLPASIRHKARELLADSGSCDMNNSCNDRIELQLFSKLHIATNFL